MEQEGKSVSLTPEGLRDLSDEELAEIAMDAGEQHRKALANVIAAEAGAQLAQQMFEQNPGREAFIEAGVQTQIARNAWARIEAHTKSFQPLFDEIERRGAN